MRYSILLFILSSACGKLPADLTDVDAGNIVQGIVFDGNGQTLDRDQISAYVDILAHNVANADPNAYTYGDVLETFITNHPRVEFIPLAACAKKLDCWDSENGEVIKVVYQQCVASSMLGHELLHWLHREAYGDSDSQHADARYFGFAAASGLTYRQAQESICNNGL